MSTRLFNRMLAFDEASGLLTVEPGVCVGDLLRFAVSRGWYPPVLPGHPRITVGGCAAFNVHGKSQEHSGNFIDCVREIRLFHPRHGEVTCSRETGRELFELTLGGFGLTGFITRLDLRLERLAGRSVLRRRIPVRHLFEAVEVMRANAGAADVRYSWNDLNRRGDGFGRGVVYVESFETRAVEGTATFRPLSPGWRGAPLWNGPTTRLFTGTWGRLEALRPREERLDLETAAFPINGRELYYAFFGRRGFREYQVILPLPGLGGGRARDRPSAGRLGPGRHPRLAQVVRRRAGVAEFQRHRRLPDDRRPGHGGGRSALRTSRRDRSRSARTGQPVERQPGERRAGR